MRNGVQRQRWETFNTNAEAKKRKSEVEFQQNSGTSSSRCQTLDDLLREYMSIYGVNTWAMSTYESHKALITNYISPIIGDMKLDDINTRVMDQYFRASKKSKASPADTSTLRMNTFQCISSVRFSNSS
jgi:hypothetical protein